MSRTIDLAQPEGNSMNVSYNDWDQPEIIWYSPRTLVLGMSKDEDREWANRFFSSHHADVLDLYRDPEKLIPNIYEFPCFLRIVDYKTYQLIEGKVAEFVKDVPNPHELTPMVVYDASDDKLIDNISIINGSNTHPKMLAAFYIFLTKRL